MILKQYYFSRRIAVTSSSVQGITLLQSLIHIGLARSAFVVNAVNGTLPRASCFKVKTEFRSYATSLT